MTGRPGRSDFTGRFWGSQLDGEELKVLGKLEHGMVFGLGWFSDLDVALIMTPFRIILEWAFQYFLANHF